LTYEEKIELIRRGIGIPILIFITITIIIAIINGGFKEDDLSLIFPIIIIIIIGIIQILFFKKSLKPKKRKRDKSYSNITDYKPLEPKQIIE